MINMLSNKKPTFSYTRRDGVRGHLPGAGLVRRDHPEDPGDHRHQQEGDPARLLRCGCNYQHLVSNYSVLCISLAYK